MDSSRIPAASSSAFYTAWSTSSTRYAGGSHLASMIRYGAGEDDWGIEPSEPVDDIYRSEGHTAGGVATSPPLSSGAPRGLAGVTGQIVHFNRARVPPAMTAASTAETDVEATAAEIEPEECSITICLETTIEGVR